MNIHVDPELLKTLLLGGIGVIILLVLYLTFFKDPERESTVVISVVRLLIVLEIVFALLYRALTGLPLY
jgi:hypothetical protein